MSLDVSESGEHPRERSCGLLGTVQSQRLLLVIVKPQRLLSKQAELSTENLIRGRFMRPLRDTHREAPDLCLGISSAGNPWDLFPHTGGRDELGLSATQQGSPRKRWKRHGSRLLIWLSIKGDGSAKQAQVLPPLRSTRRGSSEADQA
ncbi:hypothetical protein EYD10_08500 [Varanus komodoensis]|nr:hypothetical protein EYD10_08500 [Varanus komodoensis]